MIEVTEYPLLAKHMTSLRKTSKDDNAQDNITYMTDSNLSVINFDAVAKEYARVYHIKGIPTSNDALYIAKDGKLVFIEFKNGIIDKPTLYNIKQKNYESIIVLTDILGKTVSYTRTNVEYILVYNGEKNSKRSIANHFTKKAKNNFVQFGLEMFKGYCFSNVYTYTKDEFDNIFIKKSEQGS